MTTGPYHLAAAQGRASARMGLHQPPVPQPPRVGLIVLGEDLHPARIVGPFASEESARRWAVDAGVVLYELRPLEVPGRAG